jgi:hypothetical protein
MYKVKSENEKRKILSLFPIKNLNELCYEKIIHNKVNNWDYHLAIPEGKLVLVWFVYYNNENVCFLIELSFSKQIKHIYKVLLSYSDYLCIDNGTILYGRLVKMNHSMSLLNCVSIEDIFYYKGDIIKENSYGKKLGLLKYIFNNELSQIVLTYNSLLIGLCVMSHKLNDLMMDISTLPYKINYIQFRNENKKDVLLIKYDKNLLFNNNSNNNNNNSKEKVFTIIPDIQNDIYKLYNNDEYYDIALIPDYNTSVLMNKLFRNIKENRNLDLLEESDDETEFENINLDKYVDLSKSLKMKCVFHHKFKKWYPICVV